MTIATTRYQAPGFGSSVMSSALRSPFAHGLRHNLCQLRYQARRSGHHIATPWPLSVWIDGRWYRALPDSLEREDATAIYQLTFTGAYVLSFAIVRYGLSRPCPGAKPISEADSTTQGAR
ncbi:hypothetical protein [Nocardia australiensis]|uniref:hypothetical protein n=1 Tax=Nocardia australiensis TaxID=2887191 RepID=UPI001D13AFC5|nr:hypothetical protein [Nocardia australiensis]